MTMDLLNLTRTSNVNVAGRWMFRVDDTEIILPPASCTCPQLYFDTLQILELKLSIFRRMKQHNVLLCKLTIVSKKGATQRKAVAIEFSFGAFAFLFLSLLHSPTTEFGAAGKAPGKFQSQYNFLCHKTEIKLSR